MNVNGERTLEKEVVTYFKIAITHLTFEPSTPLQIQI
jgi:hypothetical protein